MGFAGSTGRRLPPPSCHHLERRVGGIAPSQPPPRPAQYPLPPRPQMPSEIGLRLHSGRRQQVCVAFKRRGARRPQRPRRRQRFPQLQLAAHPLRLEEGSHQRLIAKRKLRQRRGAPRQQPRIVQGATQDEPRHRVEIGGHDFAAEPHRFERDGTATGEGVEDTGGSAAERLVDLLAKAEKRMKLPAFALRSVPLPIALRVLFTATPRIAKALPPPMQNPTPRRLPDLFARLVGLRHHLPRHPQQQLPPLLGIHGRWQEGREQRGPARRQRPPRRPDVQRGDVAVANVLFVDRVEGDLLQGEGGLDEAAGGHGVLAALCLRQR